MRQGFGSGGGGDAGCRGDFCEKNPQCQSESVSAGTKMDLLLGKAEPISIVGGTFVITFRKW